ESLSARRRLGGLAAAGVAWMFARDVDALLKERGDDRTIDSGLMTAAAGIGTIADVVPMTNLVNRYIVQEGLREMNSDRHHALTALRWLSGEKKFTQGNIAFTFGPYFNAGSRMGEPARGMNLLKSQNAEEQEHLAKELSAANDARKQV